MKKLILLACMLTGLTTALQAQFPYMGINGDVLYTSPTSTKFAVGGNAIYSPYTRLFVNNGQLQVRSADDGRLLQLNTPSGLGSSIRQSQEGALSLTDWSPLLPDSLKNHYFTFYRHQQSAGAQGLRLYSNATKVSTQISSGGNDSYFREGNVGFGTDEPEARVHVNGGGIRVSQDVGGELDITYEPGIGASINSFNTRIEAAHFWVGHYDSPLLRVNSELNHVLIGNGPSMLLPYGYRLGVKGKVLCTELTVQEVSDWPDYVFADDYERLSFSALRQYIDREGHLPGMPSAEAVEEAGQVDVGDMQRRLLKKVEELTLYTLDLKAENDELRQRLDALENQNK